MSVIPFGYCQCGCGQKTAIIKYNNKRRGEVRGQPARFIKSHNFHHQRGVKHYRYNYGIYFMKRDKRWMINCRDGSTVPFCHAIMEAALKRNLRSDEVVHHINGDSTCDEIWNLKVMSYKEHISLHHHKHYFHSTEQILSFLQEIHRETGVVPTRSLANSKRPGPSVNTIIRRFGTWDNALREAGLAA